MSIQRDNSPERISEREVLRTRSELVEASALSAEASLYNEFAKLWGKPEPTPVAHVPLHEAGSVIDRTFMEANIQAQVSQLASDRAISDAQRRVMEALDEFPA